ncbi:MAG TPA: hypothetical protein VNK49_05355 [Anaerolineales bacterium]|nr:hypothetical protein [Anaerolineales bacterium]
MLSPSDFLHLPYTSDLTEGGIAYATHSLPYTYNRMGGSPYHRLRRIVAGIAVELAFRRYLSEQNIPFDVKGATPFTDPDRYDVSLGGKRCDIKSFLITHRNQITEIKRNPGVVLKAPALVPSDQHVAEGHSAKDIYIFAFLLGLVTASRTDWKKVIATGLPHYLVHVMPDRWARPPHWHSLGALVLKSESAETQLLEIGGQDEGREMRRLVVELPPRTRVQLNEELFSLAYVHINSLPKARIGIHSPVKKETYLINGSDWSNIWVYGMDILLTGWLTHEEFGRRASPMRAGVRVFQYDQTRTKNLAVPVSDLKPLSALFQHAR